MKKRLLTAAAAIVMMLTLSLSIVPNVMAAGSVSPAPSAQAPSSSAAQPSSGTNKPPVAENLELSTFRNVSVAGTLTAVDPEGDLITFEITTEARKGAILLSEDGSFTYTPADGKKGKDYFGYRAIDSSGNKSQEATVIIKIEKQKTKLSYSDMKGSGGEYAALSLAEKGIFTGACVGGDYVFEPSRAVTRGEFLAMCMKLTNTQVLTGVTRTGFIDDDIIPMWVKPYVSTAVLSGVISGYGGDIGGPVFDSEAPISYSEAAVMLNRVLGIADVPTVAEMYEGSIPVWAYQATANLSSCRIMPQGIQSMAGFLTRTDAAEMLLGADRIISER